MWPESYHGLFLLLPGPMSDAASQAGNQVARIFPEQARGSSTFDPSWLATDGVEPLDPYAAPGDYEDEDGGGARLVTLPHGAPYRQTAMDHLGLDPVTMNHLVLAYTHGGPGGVAAYLEPFTVDPDVLTRAQADIQPLRPAPHATIECRHNHLTDHAAGIQLRYGPDGRWHPYRNPYGPWQPVPGSSPDPAHAYRTARAGRIQHSATRRPRK